MKECWPYIIGVSGRKQAGKDSTYTFLQRYGDRLFAGPVRPVCRVGFADDMKEMLHHVIGLDRSKLHGTEEDKQSPCPLAPHHTYRDACKIVGQAFRQLDPECWTRRTMLMVKARRQYGYHVVLTDVRRVAEVEAIHAAGGKVLRLMRTGGEPDNHPIERELDGYCGFDAAIDNSAPDFPEDWRNAMVVDALTQWGWAKIL